MTLSTLESTYASLCVRWSASSKLVSSHAQRTSSSMRMSASSCVACAVTRLMVAAAFIACLSMSSPSVMPATPCIWKPSAWWIACQWRSRSATHWRSATTGIVSLKSSTMHLNLATAALPGRPSMHVLSVFQ